MLNYVKIFKLSNIITFECHLDTTALVIENCQLLRVVLR